MIGHRCCKSSDGKSPFEIELLLPEVSQWRDKAMILLCPIFIPYDLPVPQHLLFRALADTFFEVRTSIGKVRMALSIKAIIPSPICPFLEEGKGCKIYPERPIVCRLFPISIKDKGICKSCETKCRIGFERTRIRAIEKNHKKLVAIHRRETERLYNACLSIFGEEFRNSIDEACERTITNLGEFAVNAMLTIAFAMATDTIKEQKEVIEKGDYGKRWGEVAEELERVYKKILSRSLSSLSD